MSIHIGAKKGEIADKVILPGDPYRAKYIAENFLTDAKLHNEVRGMLGYTGTYNGTRISVQGTGMGVPSASIYTTELIQEYGCKELIRIGTCGSLRESVKVLDIILAQGASTDSSINKEVFGTDHFAPIADFDLLYKSYNIAKENYGEEKCHVGNILTSDLFYHDEVNQNHWQHWERHGILGIEMETAGIYSLAAKYGVKALAMFSVTDHFVTKEIVPSETRETALNDMITLALDTLSK